MTQTATRPATDDPIDDPIDAPVREQGRTGLGDALTAALDGAYHGLRQQVRDSLTADDLLRDPSMSMAEARAWVKESLVALAARGWGNAGYPVDGKATDVEAGVVSFEALAHGDLSLTIKGGVQFGLFGGAIEGLGTEQQVREWLPDIIATRHLGCFAMTELGHGSDVHSLETTLTYDPETDEIVVHSPTPTATKAYIGNAAEHGRSAATFGQLWVDGVLHGVHCVLVPIRDDAGADLPGVTTADHGHKGGLLGVDNGMITFDQVRVPRTNLLAKFGLIDADGRYVSAIDSESRRFFTMLGTLVRGRVCVGAAAGIAGRRALSIATRYALQRRQFPVPGGEGEVLLLDYASHQRRLFPWIARAYALGFAHNDLIRLLVECRSPSVTEARRRELESRAAGLKVAETRFANDVCQVAREACGGAGYMAENQLTLLRNDVDIFATFEGDNTVLQQLVAKGLLLGYREGWTGLDRRETFVKTADLVGRMVVELTYARTITDRLVAAARRQSGEASILDRSWHALMFVEREKHVLESLAARLQAAAKASDRFAAVNALQDHMIYAAHVHTDRIVLESFIGGIEAVSDPEAKRVLNKLCDLYAVSTLCDDRGWFLEHGRMSAARSKSLVTTVDRLCADLRPHALAVVEGLGIPSHLLGAQMIAPQE